MTELTVLIADDDPQMLRALRITLTARGYSVITATNGAEAVNAAIAHKPDLLMLDLGMPELDGLDVIHAIRGWSAVPILVVSGRTGAADKVEALDAGADDYVTKPFVIDEVLARIRALTRRAPSGDSPAVVTMGDVTIDLASAQHRASHSVGSRLCAAHAHRVADARGARAQRRHARDAADPAQGDLGLGARDGHGLPAGSTWRSYARSLRPSPASRATSSPMQGWAIASGPTPRLSPRVSLAACVATSIRFVAFEDLGVWEPEIRAHGYEVRYLDAGVDDVAEFADADLAICLGAPIDADDEAHFPYLADVRDALAARLVADRPTLGICLGAQLMSLALGGELERGNREVGWGQLELLPDAAATALRHLAGAPVLHWHQDVASMPRGSEAARDNTCESQPGVLVWPLARVPVPPGGGSRGDRALAHRPLERTHRLGIRDRRPARAGSRAWRRGRDGRRVSDPRVPAWAVITGR